MIVKANPFDGQVARALKRIYLRQRSYGRAVHRAYRRCGQVPARHVSRLPMFESPTKLLRTSGRPISYVQWRTLTTAEIR